MLRKPVIIDNGTGSIKAGFAGDLEPKIVFPTCVGRPKYKRVLKNDELDDKFLVGERARKYAGVFKLNYPLTHGIVETVQDWEDMKVIWDYALEVLDVPNSEQHSILLTEPPNNPEPNRNKASEIFFETFNVPSLYIQVQSILSLYDQGMLTGVVLDSGAGVSAAVPVYEGFAISNSVQRINVAGQDVTDYLQMLLQRGGYNFFSSSEMEIVRTIKEKHCYLSLDIEKSEEDAFEGKLPGIPYELPDGNKINLQSEMFRAPEILFDPSLFGEEYCGLHECLSKAITKSDMEIRNSLYSNIFLAGGSTMFQGFGPRLLSELKQISPKHTTIKIFAPVSRLISNWKGASTLGRSSIFNDLCVTRSDYEENGKRAVYQNMF